MVERDDDKVKILLSEYELLQNFFELQFNHFMSVFYFWIAVITAPISAGLISILSTSKLIFGILCLLVAFIGIFLSGKMFDIRRSQLRYAQKLNEIRAYFWENYIGEDKLIPLGMEDGKWVNLFQQARTDFGKRMAFIMSFLHGILALVGVISCSLSLITNEQSIYIIGIFIGIMVFVINYYWYFTFFQPKICR